MKTKEQLEKKVNILGNIMGMMMLGIFVYFFIMLGTLNENGNQTKVIVGGFFAYVILCIVVADVTDNAERKLIEFKDEQ